MELTCPFRVPLALPVFVTRRGHSDSALAEPEENGPKRRLNFLQAFIPYNCGR